MIWLGLMGALTLLAMGIWYAFFGGSQTTESLKWLQFLQTVGTFLLPAIIGAWIWSEDHKPMKWLKLDRTTDIKNYLLAVGIMVCAIPAINLLADLNGRIRLPESLGFIEQQMKQMEEAAAELTERFLQADNVGVLLVNIGLMALLPALAEELSFRGTLQQIITNHQSPKTKLIAPLRQRITNHVAIWVTAFIFSAIHMQFYGFIPRMLMGAMFGYIFLWTGCLWVPVLMHFTNNALAVIAYYLTSQSDNGLTGDAGLTSKSIADTFGAGDTWWVGVLSLILTSLGLLIFYRRTHKQ